MDASSTADVDRAIGRLKAWQPWTLQVTTIDGEVKPVKVPEQRTKWESIKQTLIGLKWVKIEARNKRGEVVGVVSADGAEADGLGLDAELSSLGGGTAGVLKFVAYLVTLNSRTVDMALRRDRERIETLLSAHNKLVESVVARFVGMNKAQMDLLQRYTNLQARLAAGDGDSDDLISGMFVEEGVRHLLGLPAPVAVPKPGNSTPAPGASKGSK
jgi:hypothetical protein